MFFRDGGMKMTKNYSDLYMLCQAIQTAFYPNGKLKKIMWTLCAVYGLCRVSDILIGKKKAVAEKK